MCRKELSFVSSIAGGKYKVCKPEIKYAMANGMLHERATKRPDNHFVYFSSGVIYKIVNTIFHHEDIEERTLVKTCS